MSRAAGQAGPGQAGRALRRQGRRWARARRERAGPKPPAAVLPGPPQRGHAHARPQPARDRHCRCHHRGPRDPRSPRDLHHPALPRHGPPPGLLPDRHPAEREQPPERPPLAPSPLGPWRVPHGGHAGGALGREVHTALDPVQSGHDGPLVAVGGGEQDARADQLQLEAGRVGAAHLGQALVDEVGGPAQFGGAEGAGLGLHALDDVGGGVDEPLLGRVRDGGEDHQVTQPLQQIGDEPTGIVPALDDAVDDLEGLGAVTGGEGLDDGVEEGAVGVSEQGRRHGVRHTVRSGAGQQLVHDGHGVTHGPATGAHDEREDTVLDRDGLLLAHLGEVLPQGPGRDEPERVVMGPRPDGPDDLLGLGGREDELEMLRRFLDDLQQRVEAGRRDHVGLVDDVDLVPAAGRSEEGLLAQVTGVVHATVGSGVDLDDVDGTGSVAREVLTGLALTARRGRRALLAVQTPRQDPGTGRLATAARPAEQVRVVDPVVAQRLLQRVGDVLLPDDLGEGLRAIAAVQSERRHAYEVIGAH
ncbi:putative DNA polymerase III subunit gamma/tau [Streptomyces afghaniensis 772]|uniref:Putative DNA polymerase III subunit gamma/tau n=1 Tax=Streptomyces afghaniensis 772 TaxID=1283301 RepID=S4NEP0_9ACTN|nr:putative DNA polymerase III subunit gamma/tau [Streptomyces afghaniensis 772]